jgi:hypothetical protein
MSEPTCDTWTNVRLTAVTWQNFSPSDTLQHSLLYNYSERRRHGRDMETTNRAVAPCWSFIGGSG